MRGTLWKWARKMRVNILSGLRVRPFERTSCGNPDSSTYENDEKAVRNSFRFPYGELELLFRLSPSVRTALVGHRFSCPPQPYPGQPDLLSATQSQWPYTHRPEAAGRRFSWEPNHQRLFLRQNSRPFDVGVSERQLPRSDELPESSKDSRFSLIDIELNRRLSAHGWMDEVTWQRYGDRSLCPWRSRNLIGKSLPACSTGAHIYRTIHWPLM